jgi:hypothetical protein
MRLLHEFQKFIQNIINDEFKKRTDYLLDEAALQDEHQ